MHTGWITYGAPGTTWTQLERCAPDGSTRGHLYHLGSDGVMLTGVQKINDLPYNFDPSSALVG